MATALTTLVGWGQVASSARTPERSERASRYRPRCGLRRKPTSRFAVLRPRPGLSYAGRVSSYPPVASPIQIHTHTQFLHIYIYTHTYIYIYLHRGKNTRRGKHFWGPLNRWRGHRYLEQTKSEKITESAPVKVDGATLWCCAIYLCRIPHKCANDVAEIGWNLWSRLCAMFSFLFPGSLLVLSSIHGSIYCTVPYAVVRFVHLKVLKGIWLTALSKQYCKLSVAPSIVLKHKTQLKRSPEVG